MPAQALFSFLGDVGEPASGVGALGLDCKCLMASRFIISLDQKRPETPGLRC